MQADISPCSITAKLSYQILAQILKYNEFSMVSKQDVFYKTSLDGLLDVRQRVQREKRGSQQKH